VLVLVLVLVVVVVLEGRDDVCAPILRFSASMCVCVLSLLSWYYSPTNGQKFRELLGNARVSGSRINGTVAATILFENKFK